MKRNVNGINNPNYKHGLTKHLLYYVWHSMKNRCSNLNFSQFKDYGGRGIVVCNEWQEFLPFYEWAIANGWQESLEIDRINNDGNYSPENCRFVNKRINNSNIRKKSMYGTGVRKRGNKFQCIIEINGKSKYLGTFNTPEEAQEAYKKASLFDR